MSDSATGSGSGRRYEAVDTEERPLNSSNSSWYGRNRRCVMGGMILLGCAALILVGIAAATFQQAKKAADEGSGDNNEQQSCVDFGPGMFEALATNQIGVMARYLRDGCAQCDVDEGQVYQSMMQMNARAWDGALQSLGVPGEMTMAFMIPILQAWKVICDASLTCCPGKQLPYYAQCGNDTLVAAGLADLKKANDGWKVFIQEKLIRAPSDFAPLWDANIGSVLELVQIAKKPDGADSIDYDAGVTSSVASARDVGLAMDGQLLSSP